MFIDTHAHIPLDIKESFVNNAIKNNVKVIVNQSEDLKTSYDSVDLANTFNEVFACVGVHPENVKEFKESDLPKFRELLMNKKVVAVGEIGLDYYYGKEDKDLQIKVFREFLKLAEMYDKPVVIHSRDAVMDTINILKEYNVKGIIHCFSGSLEVANIYIKMGFYLGIGGVLTFKNSKLYEVVKNISIDNLVLETDSPFLSPEPYRGKPNESKNIPIIGECLSKYLGISLEEVMNKTTSNAKNIYKL